MFDQIVESLKILYRADPRPWVIGYSGGKDSSMLVSLVFEVIKGLPESERTKDVSVVCTDK